MDSLAYVLNQLLTDDRLAFHPKYLTRAQLAPGIFLLGLDRDRINARTAEYAAHFAPHLNVIRAVEVLAGHIRQYSLAVTRPEVERAFIEAVGGRLAKIHENAQKAFIASGEAARSKEPGQRQAALQDPGSYGAVNMLTMEDAKPLVVVVSRQNVEQCDVAPTLSVLARLLESVSVIRSFEERVEIAFHGYDNNPLELYELVEVRAFVSKLDEEFPYWLFFLTKEGTGLQALAWCLMPPFLTEEGQRTVWSERLMALLERRWLPALGNLCTKIGFDESDIQQRYAAAAHYFVEGPRRPFDPSAA